MHMMKADVMVNVHDRNDHIALHVQEFLHERRVFAVNVMGAPGTGKTTTIEQVIRRLHCPSYVVEGDIESDIDTQRLQAQGVRAAQINTFGACHLDAPLLHNAVHALPLPEPGILFIENVGNLVCPAEFSIGEDIKLLQVSVTDGSDKPYKYPLAFEKASVILLTRTDLLPYVDFDEEFFMAGVRHLNREAPVFKVCGRTGEGYDAVAEWLEVRSLQVRRGEVPVHAHTHGHGEAHGHGQDHDHGHEHV